MLVLLDNHLADASVVSAERDTELQFTGIALPKPQRVTEPLWMPVWTRRRPFLGPFGGRKDRVSVGGVAVLVEPTSPCFDTPRCWS